MTAGRQKRIKLSRVAGWKMPEGATKVDRSTRWGNPYRIREIGTALVSCCRDAPGLCDVSKLVAVELFKEKVLHGLIHDPEFLEWICPLWGRDLGCWCDPESLDPCHADVLLAVAEATHGRTSLEGMLVIEHTIGPRYRFTIRSEMG